MVNADFYMTFSQNYTVWRICVLTYKQKNGIIYTNQRTKRGVKAMNGENFIITKFNNIYTANNQKGRIIELKSRYCSCFIVTLYGSIRFSYDGGSIVADSTHPVFIPEGLSYTNECIEDTKSLIFNFHTLEKYRIPEVLSRVSHRLTEETYSSIEKDVISDTRESSMTILSELYSLASKLFSISEKLSSSDEIVKKATEFICSNYSANTLTVSVVARECFVSEIYLRKLFEKKLNTTPFKYLTEVRMTRARDLARERIPIKEIAGAVGFSDIYQFSRAYKKFYGFPPSETV